MLRLALVVALVVVAACGGRAPAAVVTATPGRCAPPAADGTEVQAVFVVAGGCVALIDADVSPVSSRPAVLRERNGWREVELPDGLDNSGWVAAATDGVAIVGVIDDRIESPGWEATVIRSREGGATWQEVATLAKPYYLATIAGLRIDRGHAVLDLELDDDYGAGVVPGHYRADSRDGGATWTAFAPVPGGR